MQKLNALLRRSIPSKSTAAVLGLSVYGVAINANAAAGDIDFSTMIAGVSAAALITAIVGMGVVKLGPNFARWAINKLASFF